MTRQTGLPAARHVRVPCHRAAVLAVVILAAVLQPPIHARDVLSPRAASGHSSPDAAILTIAVAFRTHAPETLRSLLPSSGKILLSLRSVGEESGYFGRDQVYFIFEKIFRNYRTRQFDIRLQDNPRPRRPNQGLTYSVGMWAYQERNGDSGKCQIFFVLSTKDGQWSLVQIREAL